MNLNRFKQLLESKIGDVRPLIVEQETQNKTVVEVLKGKELPGLVKQEDPGGFNVQYSKIEGDKTEFFINISSRKDYVLLKLYSERKYVLLVKEINKALSNYPKDENRSVVNENEELISVKLFLFVEIEKVSEIFDIIYKTYMANKDKQNSQSYVEKHNPGSLKDVRFKKLIEDLKKIGYKYKEQEIDGAMAGMPSSGKMIYFDFGHAAYNNEELIKDNAESPYEFTIVSANENLEKPSLPGFTISNAFANWDEKPEWQKSNLEKINIKPPKIKYTPISEYENYWKGLGYKLKYKGKTDLEYILDLNKTNEFVSHVKGFLEKFPPVVKVPN